MGDIQEGHHEDIMRAFFKLRVADVGMIVIRIPEILMRAVNTAAQDLAELLPEANRVVLVSYTTRQMFPSTDTSMEVHTQISVRLPGLQQGRLWTCSAHDQPVDK